VSSPVRDELAGYLAGRVTAERLVIAVAAAYYRDPAAGSRDDLRPLIEVIDRASPGIVQLGRAESTPGFALRLVERPFPAAYEGELRRAVEACLASERTTGVLDVQRTRAPRPGVLTRLVRAVRRWFSASA
jgi:hypothetical protein